MASAQLLIPRDLLEPHRPDGHFASEADVARDLGIEVHLVDHDAIVAGDFKAGLAGLEGPGTGFVYRGWMINPARYEAFAAALAERQIELRTTAADFARAHQLPNWFPAVERFTPQSVWTVSADLDEFRLAADRLGSGPAVIKDYSKSEKHYWDEAMFIPELADHRVAIRVAARFLELRGDSFDTGFVIRRFENLEPGEWRSWWVDGSWVMTTAHPDTPEVLPDKHLDLVELAPVVRALDLRFVSVDVARSADSGQLRVIEVGDGQVSDRPSSCEPAQFVSAIVGIEDS